VKGDVGIVFVQEADDFNSVQSGAAAGGGGRGGRGGAAGGGATAAGAYVQSLQGAYQAFFDSNIQADFVSIDNIGEYPMIYLAFPEMLKKTTADKLREYVINGGKLVSEGLPGYFGDGGTVGTVQPNLGLDQLFGARESYVQFTPDILDKLTLTVRDKQIGGGYFLQEYKLAGGQSVGQYTNGQIAAVEHAAGNGKTLLIGTFPGGSYFRNHSSATRDFFSGLLTWAGVKQQVQSSDPAVKARLHQGAGGTYVWVVNPTRTARTVKVSLPTAFKGAADVWQESNHPAISGNTLTTTVEDRNVAVIRLDH
jgi:beta-galactosidase